MSGLTLPAAVTRGRHRKPTWNQAECVPAVAVLIVVRFGVSAVR